MLKMNLLMLGIAISSVIAFTQEQHTNGPMRDYPMRDYVIDFDELPPEFEVTSYYDGITFEIVIGAMVTYPWATGTSQPNIITSSYPTELISIIFSPGAYNLTFLITDLNLVGPEADVMVFENGSVIPSDMIMVDGTGTPNVPIMLDFRAYQNVTRVDILNISGNGGPDIDDIFLDNFLFSKYCSLPQDLPLESWPVPGTILPMIDLITALCP